jgi:hypothetical protein
MHAFNFSGATHDPKFLTVTWFGENFKFSPQQAKCVQVLWNFWKLRTPIIREEMVLEIAGIQARSLKDVFTSGPGKNAWGTMIGAGDRRGTVQLVEPEAASEAAAGHSPNGGAAAS